MVGADGAAPGTVRGAEPLPRSRRRPQKWVDAGADRVLAGLAHVPVVRSIVSGQSRAWARLGLRARLTLMFGLGALLLSLLMGGLSYFTARQVLVSERQSSVLHQAYLNAALVRSNLADGGCSHPVTYKSIKTIFGGLDKSGSISILYECGIWYGSSLSVGEGAIPLGMRQMVTADTPATLTFDLAGSPQMAVGVPLPAQGASYFELFNVSDLARILEVLALAIVAGGTVTTLLGAAVGRSAANRALRPLTNVSRAALAIAGGDLGTRVPEATNDSDLAALTRSFNRMIEQLQERIEREARFSSDVSHELRSPLTTLSASLDVLEEHRDELGQRGRQALELLGPDLRRFERMVGELLEISRSDTGSADVSLEDVDAGELVRQSVAASTRTLRARLSATDEGRPSGHRPEVVLDPAVASVRLLVDKRRFERIITNLLENAAVYAGGATRVTAVPGAPRADGRPTVRIAVEDNGPGIPPAERSRIFQRFYRGQASGRRGTGTGTGLGLALVAEHVRLNGGTVWVEEADGGGSRFAIELPVSDEVDEEDGE